VLRTHLIHARDIIRDLGLRRGLGMGPRWLQARRFHLVASPIDATLDVAPLTGARCEVLTERDLWAFVRGCQAVSAREVRRRWRARAECLVCWIDGEVAAYRWDTAGTAYLPYLSRWLRGAPGDGLVLECRTLPGRRRTGAGSLLVEARFARARRQGIRRHVGLIAEWNRPSLAWAAGLGWSQLGAIGYRWTLRGRRYFAEGALRLDGDEVAVLATAPVESLRRA
jgi:GNAT superfamily N-acetyltransferase